MEVEISFKLLLKSLFKHLWTILLIVLVVAILTAVYTYFFMTPVYMAKTASNLLVNDLNATQGSNLNTTIGMMSTYATKVKSDETMQTASDMIANGQIPPEDLRELISVSFEKDGTILYISAIYTDPVNAARIADAVTQAAKYSMSGVEWEITNSAVVPEDPVTPNMIKNVGIVALLALVLSYGFFLLTDIYNTKIVTEEQLSSVLDLPVIGAIPMVETVSKPILDKEDAQNGN